MLTVERISKVFGEAESGYPALKEISLEIRDGEFLCLLGPSGCGKTTLLNILAGFDAATFGRAALNGRTISAPNSERMMFFQDAGSALFPWQTVEQNVRCGLKLQKVRGPEQDRRVDYYLGMVGLAQHRDGIRFRKSAQIVEVAVLPIGVFDGAVAMTHRRRRQDGDGVLADHAHELAPPMRKLLAIHGRAQCRRCCAG